MLVMSWEWEYVSYALMAGAYAVGLTVYDEMLCYGLRVYGVEVHK